MTLPILIIQNIPRERAGLIEVVFKERHIAFETIEINNSTKLPPLEKFRGLIVMGGTDSANDSTPKMTKERNLVTEALAKKIPYLGVCLGMQVLAKACGAEVIRAPIPEMGFRGPAQETFLMSLTDEGLHDPIFKNLEKDLPVFQLHRQTITAHKRIVLLARGDFVKFQAIKVGENAYGFQCHFELTETMFLEWLREDPDLRKMELPLLLEDYERLKPTYEKIGRQLVENFLMVVSA